MSYLECDNEDSKDRGVIASRAPGGLQAQMRKAFREWLDASKAWSTLCRTLDAEGDSSTAKRELRKMERRLNAAADAFKQTQQRLSEYTRA